MGVLLIRGRYLRDLNDGSIIGIVNKMRIFCNIMAARSTYSIGNYTY